MSRGTRDGLAFLGAAALIAAVLAWPLRHGRPYLDDYLFLALARHIDSPWRFFTQDSVGVFFFRPVALFAWWASDAAFSGSPGAHYAFNMALHAGCGVALWVALRAFEIPARAAGATALAFLAHPAAFGAAAWLSDRFDLLATGFGLLAIAAAENHLRRPRASMLVAAAACLLAALGSKEIAYAVAALLLLMAVAPVPGRPFAAHWRSRLALFAAVALVAGGSLLWRESLLRPGSQAMFLSAGLAATMLGAASRFLGALPGVAAVRHGPVVAVYAWGALLAGGLAVGALLAARDERSPARWRAAILGMALAVLAVLAQAPILNASPVPSMRFGEFEFEALSALRFFYLPLAALAMAAALPVAALGARLRSPPARAAGVAATLAVLVALLATSRAIGRDFMGPAHARLAADEAAIAAAVQVASAATGAPCKLYFLGTPTAADGFAALADVAVKASLPPGHPALGCFIQTDRAPWYHLLSADPARAGQAPLETIDFRGKPYPPLAVGSLHYYYLRIPDTGAVRQDPTARFHAWDGHRFVDVTGEVRSGERPVRFIDNRPKA